MWKSTATYAVAASNGEGAICLTVPHAGRPVMFFVTLFHFAPPSRVFHS